MYSSFFAALIMNFIPSFTIQTIGGLLFFFLFILSYILKYNAKKESFEYAHYAYITKTIWIFSLFLTIGVLVAAVFADNSNIHELTANLMNGIILTEEQMIQKLVQYGMRNLLLFLLIFIPITLYFAYRLIKGAYYIQKDTPPANPKNWF